MSESKKQVIYGEIFTKVVSLLSTSDFPNLNIHWPNVAADVPTARDGTTQSTEPYARITCQEVGQEAASIGRLPGGKKRWRCRGIVLIEFYLPLGGGLVNSTGVTTIISDGFSSHRTSGGCWFPSTPATMIGEDGSFYRSNVVLNYMYDEFR